MKQQVCLKCSCSCAAEENKSLWLKQAHCYLHGLLMVLLISGPPRPCLVHGDLGDPLPGVDPLLCMPSATLHSMPAIDCTALCSPFSPCLRFCVFLVCVCACAWLRWCSTSRGLLRSQTPNENKRKHSGESAVIRWKERVARGWKNKDVKKWGDGRRRHEIPWWVLLSSCRITAAATITSAALPVNTPVPLKMRYPALERNQMITFTE